MRKMGCTFFVSAAFCIGLLWMQAGIVCAAISNGQSADLVVGQANFTSNTSGTGAGQFNRPLGTVKDPVSGKIFGSSG